MPGLDGYGKFLKDLDQELERIRGMLSRGGRGAIRCKPKCSECCRPITVLPIEAHAVLEGSTECGEWRPHSSPDNHCPFLSKTNACQIYNSRPFLCRTRGFPVSHIGDDGEWESDGCRNLPYDAAVGFPKERGLVLEKWNARLYRLNTEFCAAWKLPHRRISMAALLSAARADRALARPCGTTSAGSR